MKNVRDNRTRPNASALRTVVDALMGMQGPLFIGRQKKNTRVGYRLPCWTTASTRIASVAVMQQKKFRARWLSRSPANVALHPDRQISASHLLMDIGNLSGPRTTPYRDRSIPEGEGMPEVAVNSCDRRERVAWLDRLALSESGQPRQRLGAGRYIACPFMKAAC
jgi:hypothetical protein